MTTYRFSEPIIIESASNLFSGSTFVTDKSASDVIKEVSSDSGVETNQSLPSFLVHNRSDIWVKENCGSDKNYGILKTGQLLKRCKGKLRRCRVTADGFLNIYHKYETKAPTRINLLTSQLKLGTYDKRCFELKIDNRVYCFQTEDESDQKSWLDAIIQSKNSASAEQKQPKWECNDCMTSNDEIQSKCACCERANLNAVSSSVKEAALQKPTFSFGGASATSRHMTLNHQDLPMYHRPRVPANLFTSRSTSSLNTVYGGASSTWMSTTAKRILDVMSKYNTPLIEVRRISNALPPISESSVLNKHKSILELESTGNELDKSKRTLLKPNTPYSRPFGRNPVESMLTTELHIPSMPELLQLKKFTTSTMKIRDIASQSDSILNKPVATKVMAAPTAINDFRFTKTVSNRDGDLDASNNNKFVNNKNDAISNSASDAHKEHKNKIRRNLTKRKMYKCADDDARPEPVNLPNIPLVKDEKAEIKFSEPFKLQNTEKATGTTMDNGLQIPFKFKSSNKNIPAAPAITKEKRTNGNDTEITPKRFEISTSKLVVSTTPATSFNARPTSSPIADFKFKPQPAINHSRASVTYRFTQPIVIEPASNSFEQHNKLGSNKSAYKFSEPTFITDKPAGDVAKTDTPKSLANFKFDSIGSKANKSTGLFAAKPSFGTSTDNGFSAGKTVLSFSTQLHTFKSLVVKQKEGKWECKDCLGSNEATASKCVCFGSAQKANPPVKATQSQPAVATVDDVFKSIVAKQKQSKWECNDCMTSNDEIQSKCACCGGANPNAALPLGSVTDSKAAAPLKPTFSFGSLPSSSTTSAIPASSKPVDSVFKAIVDKQKRTWECSACLSANDMSKSKCCCCEQSRDVTKGATTSGVVPAKPQFSFGTGVSFAPKSTFSNLASGSSAATTAAPATVSAAPTFTFGTGAVKTTPSAQFSFGTLKAPKSTPAVVSSNGKNEDKAKEPVQKTPVTALFSFGNVTTLPSTSKIETKPEQAAAFAPFAAYDVFKSIVEQNNCSWWECLSCLNGNPNCIEKCAYCGTKEGTPSKDNSKMKCVSFLFGSAGSSSMNAPAFGLETDNSPLAIINSGKGNKVLENVLVEPSKTEPPVATSEPMLSSGPGVINTTTKARKRSYTDQGDTCSSNPPSMFGQPLKMNNTLSASWSSDHLDNELESNPKQNSPPNILPFPPSTKTYFKLAKTGVEKVVHSQKPPSISSSMKNKSKKGTKSCDRCGYKTEHGGHFNLHKIEGCRSIKSVKDQNCIVCCQPFSYNGLRYHLNQYLNDTSKANNGHQNFSPETHKNLLDKLKEEKKLQNRENNLKWIIV